MPKRILKKILPHRSKITNHKNLKRIRHLFNYPDLWHVNKHCVARAISIGLFVTFLPLPFQMLIAAVLAVWFRANMILSVILVWISNPFTIPWILYFAYHTGDFLINGHQNKAVMFKGLRISEFGQLWHPLIIGLFIFSVFSSIIAYFITRILWRIFVSYRWSQRKKKYKFFE